jgi:uncharacterized membrane protein
MNRRTLLGPASLVAAVVTSLAAFPFLPARVPVHWDIHGNPDRYGSRLEAALVMPLAMAVVLVLLRVLRRRGRLAPDQDDGGARDTIEGLVVALMALGHGAVIFAGLGVVTNMARAMGLIIAVFLLLGGNVTGRLRRNRVTGIRTPWTLASDDVWRRTHRVAARTMVLAGFALVPLALSLRGAALVVATLTLLFAATLAPAVWSYVLAHRARR